MALTARIRKKVPGFSLDVSIEEDHEVLALLGKSGCGKSMTLMCIAGILKPDEGRIVLNGRVLYDSEQRINVPPQKRRVGYLFQQYALFPNMTVLGNVAAGVREGTRKERRQKALLQLHAFRLEDCSGKYPSELSGGQKQRCALARIMASEPELLLLDEPFSALDEDLKWQLELEVSETIRNRHMETLFVSHNREECQRLCDSISGMADGVNEKKVPVADLYAHPVTKTQALLSGCRNIFPAAKGREEGTLYLPDWGRCLRTAGTIPEGVRFAAIRDAQLEKGGGDADLPCTVEGIVRNQVTAVAVLRVGEGGTFYLEKPLAQLEGLAEGERAALSIRPEDVMPLV